MTDRHEYKVPNALTIATPPGDKHVYLFYRANGVDGKPIVTRLSHVEVQRIARVVRRAARRQRRPILSRDAILNWIASAYVFVFGEQGL